MSGSAGVRPVFLTLLTLLVHLLRLPRLLEVLASLLDRLTDRFLPRAQDWVSTSKVSHFKRVPGALVEAARSAPPGKFSRSSRVNL